MGSPASPDDCWYYPVAPGGSSRRFALLTFERSSANSAEASSRIANGTPLAKTSSRMAAVATSRTSGSRPRRELHRTNPAVHFLRVVHLSGRQRSRHCGTDEHRNQPSASVPDPPRSSDRAPQPGTSRTASATPIERLVRWHCRSASRLDCAHLERLDR
jgi:hypothetical protein